MDHSKNVVQKNGRKKLRKGRQNKIHIISHRLGCGNVFGQVQPGNQVPSVIRKKTHGTLKSHMRLWS